MSSPASAHVVPLVDLRKDQASQFGGKAAMLGEMLADGLRVLEGVAVATEVYQSALDSSGAYELAAEFWQEAWSSDTATDALESLSERITTRLMELDLSNIAEAVLAQLLQSQSAHPELIVRSSATGEDSTHLSYAGQFTSQRCSADRRGLALAIAAVWASCTAPHVAVYHTALASGREQGARTESPSMGLVVQPWHNFSISGLLFTRHPTVALDGWLLLEYLDEQPVRLVSGEVVPHACRVHSTTGRVVWERRIEGRPTLTRRSLSELVASAARLKRLMGTDIDVEWGVLDGQVHLLQSRPTTTRLL